MLAMVRRPPVKPQCPNKLQAHLESILMAARAHVSGARSTANWTCQRGLIGIGLLNLTSTHKGEERNVQPD
jgi:hypothetical protein